MEQGGEMGRDDLVGEVHRLERHPLDESIGLLGLLVVTPAGDGSRYAQRLRGLIAAAVEIARSADFESDEVSGVGLPSWFLALSTGAAGDVPGDAMGSAGKRRYLEVRDDRSWSSDEWIYCFDPDLRAWSWWDITVGDNGKICVWVDTKGEAHIPCEELWWAVFAAGAASVERLTLEYASVWAEQPEPPWPKSSPS
ncbi:hypothetical protein ORV05_09120 [Amycolatopsis cynarae]|uniref:SMI1/KNR4 family protein n=1 Tax=Amycolatopsis cynarae TaxID=2995223 RepID=A0ABY7B6Y4_9PSEU|nr:hypothetical protein [Amycolatopsis sp. HUAS 11-8]WAL67911.1 hypothetical protein ORV05_09120 [Amycolatopsis sp. HUAS 11-8]